MAMFCDCQIALQHLLPALVISQNGQQLGHKGPEGIISVGFDVQPGCIRQLLRRLFGGSRICLPDTAGAGEMPGEAWANGGPMPPTANDDPAERDRGV